MGGSSYHIKDKTLFQKPFPIKHDKHVASMKHHNLLIPDI